MTKTEIINQIVSRKCFALQVELGRSKEAILTCDIDWLIEEVTELYEELADNEDCSEELGSDISKKVINAVEIYFR